MNRLVVLGVMVLLVAIVFAFASAGGSDDGADTAEGDPAGGDGTPGATPTPAGPADFTGAVFAPAPDVPDGPVAPATVAILDRIFTSPLNWSEADLTQLAATGDPRVLWLVSDLMRFVSSPDQDLFLRSVAEDLSGIDLTGESFGWGPLTDHLLAWDLPAPEGYAGWKASLFTAVEDGWRPFFDDEDATIDWRQVSWGGVFIDDRTFGDPNPCIGGCIPALDRPTLVPADEGDYYPDERIVFGVVIGDEAVAFPRNIMEIHEMVNTTIGGRQVAIPYCTLCGAAQVFFTDTVDGAPADPQDPPVIVMRTSGLLRRSNKVMYDLTTQTVFDTFTGEAVSGPLREEGVVLEQSPVVTSTWADWKAAHPDTLIVAGDGGIGRTYPLDPLRGRDDDGPIFPIGEVDPRLGVHEQVLGVELADGTLIAFPVEQALAVIADGGTVELEGVEVQPDAGGVVALLDGEQLPAHQAFWFAWSQFHPDTLLWEGPA